ncbi:MAG: YdbH domain-containing protein [Candidatus Omnitrophica bacterium]|nr:YdbH domain-containing protein [Candidatus Omnitrophota bacterium]
MFSDIKIKRQGSCDLSIKEVGIKYHFPSLFTGTIGDFYVKKITCNDAVIRDVQGTVRIENSVLSVDSLTARLFNGSLSGNLQLALDKNNEFSVVLTSAGLNLGTFSEDFKLDDKFQITGKLNGTISLRGGRAGITYINGDFSTDVQGGMLVIKDTRFLENMAKRSGQSLDILIENFEHYQYNKGMMNVSVDENDLVLDIALDGDTGKRTFDVILHDVITNKGGGL